MRICAKAFCFRGYGVMPLREQLKKHSDYLFIHQDKYKTYANRMASESYRMLQTIIEDLHIQKRKLTKHSRNLMHTIVLNIRQHMNFDEINIYMKIVASIYDVQGFDNIIRKGEIIYLYQQLHSKLLKKLQSQTKRGTLSGNRLIYKTTQTQQRPVLLIERSELAQKILTVSQKNQRIQLVKLFQSSRGNFGKIKQKLKQKMTDTKIRWLLTCVLTYGIERMQKLIVNKIGQHIQKLSCSNMRLIIGQLIDGSKMLLNQTIDCLTKFMLIDIQDGVGSYQTTNQQVMLAYIDITKANGTNQKLIYSRQQSQTLIHQTSKYKQLFSQYQSIADNIISNGLTGKQERDQSNHKVTRMEQAILVDMYQYLSFTVHQTVAEHSTVNYNQIINKIRELHHSNSDSWNTCLQLIKYVYRVGQPVPLIDPKIMLKLFNEIRQQ